MGYLLDVIDLAVEIGEVVAALEDRSQTLDSNTADGSVLNLFFSAPSQELRDLLTAAYKKELPDPVYDRLTFHDDLWWLRDWIFVPDWLFSHILGFLQNVGSISQMMNWPGLRQDVLNCAKSYFSFQQAKHSNQRHPGLMNSLSIPDRPWRSIGFDFIVKLPELVGFDLILVIVDHFSLILVIVDHFSKGFHLTAENEFWNAE